MNKSITKPVSEQNKQSGYDIGGSKMKKEVLTNVMLRLALKQTGAKN
tara:strand:+ start:507 stop:647 length:141 start_codon:yes stop_codon:yes gene_type:complete